MTVSGILFYWDITPIMKLNRKKTMESDMEAGSIFAVFGASGFQQLGVLF